MLGTSGSPRTMRLSSYHHRALYRVLTPQTLSPAPKKGVTLGKSLALSEQWFSHWRISCQAHGRYFINMP